LQVRDYQQILLMSLPIGYLVNTEYLWKLFGAVLELLTGFLIG